MKTEQILNKVRAFEADLAKYYEATDGDIVPDIETTIIGGGGIIHYTIDKYDVTRTEKDPHDAKPFIDRWPISDPWSMEECYDQVKYDRRRLRKGWRVFKSENPDLELEKDDD